jgi:predicted transcriptional regulator
MNRITPELHTFKWSPKTKSKEDLQLVKDLEKLVKDLDLTKTQLTRKALSDFVKKRDFYSNMGKKK